MRCPDCGGGGSFTLRLQVGERTGTDARIDYCQRCDGTGQLDGLDGFPDEDGTYPIGWEPPHEPQYRRWFEKVWDTSPPDGGKNQ
jgi:hypothetical protein